MKIPSIIIYSKVMRWTGWNQMLLTSIPQNDSTVNQLLEGAVIPLEIWSSPSKLLCLLP